jgi:hypothetical protein
LDPGFYAHRARGPEELFPWDHLAPRPGKAQLQRHFVDCTSAIAGAASPPARGDQSATPSSDA